MVVVKTQKQSTIGGNGLSELGGEKKEREKREQEREGEIGGEGRTGGETRERKRKK